MSLLDTLNEAHIAAVGNKRKKEKTPSELIGVRVSSTVAKYICKVIYLVLRQNGLSMTVDKNVYNVYESKRPTLSNAILDMNTGNLRK
jgi:hypothetical protein